MRRYVPAGIARAARLGSNLGETARTTVAAAIAHAAKIRAVDPALSWWPTSQNASGRYHAAVARFRYSATTT
jgi:hypothetical protein